MTPKLFYRISSVLLVLFAIGHSIGFSTVDPSWHADAAVAGMKSVTFPVQGFTRSYWDFFFGFGVFVSIVLLFSAVLAWRWSSKSAAELATMTVERWAFAVAYVLIALATWRYFFLAPDVISTLAALALIGGAVSRPALSEPIPGSTG
ncbi:MAG TPA: hypothetical protein VIV65_12035 [Gemmatimonadaceae bacterium]